MKSNQWNGKKNKEKNWFIILTANWTESISAWFIDSISRVTGSIWIVLIIRCLTAEEMTHREVIFRGISEVAGLLWPLKLSSENIKCPSYSHWEQPLQHLIISCTDGNCTAEVLHCLAMATCTPEATFQCPCLRLSDTWQNMETTSCK